MPGSAYSLRRCVVWLVNTLLMGEQVSEDVRGLMKEYSDLGLGHTEGLRASQ